MLTPKTDKQVRAIVKNVLSACRNIKNLNKAGYDYLYLCSGFIAHYNINGFIDYYTDNSLIDDIMQFKSQNEWNKFRPGEKDYEYYHQKGEIYSMIVAELSKEFLFV